MQDELKKLIRRLAEIQEYFKQKFGVGNIYSNSKFFEILIADKLNHGLIPGHSGSRDARDEIGECEYKHYKETSSNHTWTFNDFSDSTIEKLNGCHLVIFAHIDDTKEIPIFDWYYPVPGKVISRYLSHATQKIRNTRKMINVSPRQIEMNIGIKRKFAKDSKSKNFYKEHLDEIFSIARRIEKIVETKGVLTSNKLWEILVSIYTGHKVLSEQKAHDAIDKSGKYYEYKVSQNYSWNFEDISPSVLKKFLDEKAVIMARIDKKEMRVLNLFSAEPQRVVKRLEEKLQEKESRFQKAGKSIRRLQVSLSKSDLERIGAEEIYKFKSGPTLI